MANMNQSVSPAAAVQMCEALKLKSYTAAELGSLASLTDTTVQRWLNSVRNPAVRTAYVESWGINGNGEVQVPSYRWGTEPDALQT